jgi:sugar O-acyltransferase (sialic acid O-acetyltransferase NeuD family)
MILALYGAGAMGREIRTIATEEGSFSEIVFIDDIKTGVLCGSRIYSFKEFKSSFSPEEVRFVTAFGEPRFRQEKFLNMKQAGYSGAVIKHPTAIVSEDVQIGEGAVFSQGTFTGSLVKIGDNFLAAVNCVIGHDSVIGDHVRIGAGAFIGGHTTVGDGAFLGSGSMLKDRISFGGGSVAAMGSAVFTDVPDHATVIGNPARIADDNRSGMLYSSSSAAQDTAREKELLTRDMIAEKYWDVFSSVFAGIDFNPVSFRFRDDGWESVTHMALISELEEAFGISLKGREVLKANSYQAGLEMVRKKLEEKGR